MSLDVNRVKPVETESYVRAVEEISGYIKKQIGNVPSVGVILGEGVREILEDLFVVREHIKTEQLGVVGDLFDRESPFATIRECEGVRFLCVAGGRYGPQKMEQLALPVRVMGVLGVKTLMVTNTACSLKLEMKPGDVCILSDHINLLGNSPLVGANIDEWGPRFPDMTEPYDLAFREHCSRVLLGTGVALHEGVLAAISRANHDVLSNEEQEYLMGLGADLVGFDVVPEVITARHMDLNVLGVSLVNSLCSVGSSRLENQHAASSKRSTQSIVGTLLKAIASLN